VKHRIREGEICRGKEKPGEGLRELGLKRSTCGKGETVLEGLSGMAFIGEMEGGEKTLRLREGEKEGARKKKKVQGSQRQLTAVLLKEGRGGNLATQRTIFIEHAEGPSRHQGNLKKKV